ncbi:sensor histidine kinase [Candidatus Poribacteria bacterium]
MTGSMSLYSIPPLISMLFLFSLGVASLVSGRKELMWRTFAAFCFLLMASAAVAFIITLSDDRRVVMRHFRFGPFFAILSLLFSNYYAYILTRRSDPDYRTTIRILGRDVSARTFFNTMVPVYAVLLAILFAKKMVTANVRMLDSGEIRVTHAAFMYIIMVVFLGGVIKGFYFLSRALRRSTDRNFRKFLKLNIAAFEMIYIPILLFLFILPLFGLRTHGLIFFAFPIAVMIFYIAIIRYQFDQVDELNTSLEHKVEERTQELSEKNEALEEALQQIQTVQNQLIMKEKMASLGNLVAGVAHEMNNPVGAIHSSADSANRGLKQIRNLLQDSQNVDAPKHNGGRLQRSLELLEGSNRVIVKASERIAKIVQSLKTFARLDEALFQKVDVHENIDTTLTLMDHELKDKATVIKEYGGVPPIQCYPNELNQMFMNLFMNSAQAIEDRGTIKIATSADEEQIYVSISDTGKGIAPEDLNKIFDPGFTSQKTVGKGLGLPIVYNIVQKHNGSIDIESEVGRGTEFTVALPINQRGVGYGTAK